MQTLKLIIIIINILSNLYSYKIYAKTIVIYYCEAKDGKKGYSDRPCHNQMFNKSIVEQTVLSLQNYQFIYKNNKKLYTKQQQYCSNIEEKIVFLQATLKKTRNKSVIVKLKRRITRYNLLKKKNCNTTLS